MQRFQLDDGGQGKEGCCGGRGCKEEAVAVTIEAILHFFAMISLHAHKVHSIHIEPC